MMPYFKEIEGYRMVCTAFICPHGYHHPSYVFVQIHLDMDDSLVLSMLTLGNPEMDCWRISEFDGSFDSIISLTIRFLGDYYKSDLQGLDSWNSLQTIEIIDSNCSSNYEIANDIHERYPDIRVEYGD